MEGMEGQPIKIFGNGTVYGTWKHNERRYCEGKGCGDCPGLKYDESGTGSVPKMLLDAIIITTNVWPTENKVVSDQLKQFGMENFYDIMIPGEAVDTQRRIQVRHRGRRLSMEQLRFVHNSDRVFGQVQSHRY